MARLKRRDFDEEAKQDECTRDMRKLVKKHTLKRVRNATDHLCSEVVVAEAIVDKQADIIGLKRQLEYLQKQGGPK